MISTTFEANLDKKILNSYGVNQFQSIVKRVSLYDISHGKIPFQISLLHGFSRLYACDLADIGRKLDIGVEIFGHLSNDTSEIPGF